MFLLHFRKASSTAWPVLAEVSKNIKPFSWANLKCKMLDNCVVNYFHCVWKNLQPLQEAELSATNLLASRKVTSLSSSRSVLLPTIRITMAGLASVLASVNQLAKQLNDSLKHILLNSELIFIVLRLGPILTQLKVGVWNLSRPSQGLVRNKASLMKWDLVCSNFWPGGNVINQQCPSSSSVITPRHAAEPLLKIRLLQKARRLTWPAVSQICNLTVFPPTGTILLPNSTPIVCALSSLNWPSINCEGMNSSNKTCERNWF